MFPIASLERIPNRDADARLLAWNHYLGPCNRPFGRQSFGLFWDGQLAAVAVSATTVKNSVYGFRRTDVCELARCCSHPEHRDLTRVIVRFYRKVAACEWTREYWPTSALLSYSNRARNEGDIYRFDGWARYMETRASRVGAGSHHSTKGREIPAKVLWVWPPEQAEIAKDRYEERKRETIERRRMLKEPA